MENRSTSQGGMGEGTQASTSLGGAPREAQGSMGVGRWIPARLQSLAFKNVIVFVIIAIGLVVPVAYTYLVTVERLLTDTLAAQIAVVAQRGSTLIDSGSLPSITESEHVNNANYRELREALARIRAEFEVDNAVVMRRTTSGNYAYIADDRGVFAINEAVDLHEQFPETKPPADEAFETGRMGATGLFSSGDTKWFQINVPLLDQGEVVGLLLINKFATPVAEEIARRQRQIVIGVSAVLAVGIALWWFFAVRLSRPLVALRQASLDIARGNLEVRIEEVNSLDEVGDLTRAYRRMVDDLRTSKGQVEAYTRLLQWEKDAFLRFVPTQFLELLGRDSAMAIQLGDYSPRSMSVMFSDIRGFTTLSEKLGAEHAFSFLNEYLARMGPAIENHGGFVNQFFGDGIMALFHDRASNGRTSADLAANSAIEMRRELAEYNRFRSKKGQESVRIGVGLHAGSLILGTIGSPTRLNTTVVGDTVNLASRLEAMTGHYRVGVVISDSVRDGLSDPSTHFLREIAMVRAKGKQQSVRLYDLFDWEPDDSRECKLDNGKAFAEALAHYRAGRFAEARKGFERVESCNLGDRTAEVYLTLCEKHLRTPPEDWDGVDIFQVK